MVGTKSKSKMPLFEEIDFSLFNDKDRTVSFMTDKESLPIWIKCLKEFYDNSTDDEKVGDILWSNNIESQYKILAQLNERSLTLAQNTVNSKKFQLSISFYTTTYRVVLQGISCFSWCQNNFEILKEKVLAEKGNGYDLDRIIQQLPPIHADSKVVHVDDEIAAIVIPVSNTTQNLTGNTSETQLKPTTPKRDVKSPKRYLPTPNNLTVAYREEIKHLKQCLEKLEGENIQLREETHAQRVQVNELKNTMDKQHSLIAELQQDFKILQSRNNNEKDSHIKQEEMVNRKINELRNELKKEFRIQTTALDNKYKESQCVAESKFDELKKIVETFNEIDKKEDSARDTLITNKFHCINTKIEDLETEMNKFQEEVFNGTIVNRSRAGGNKHAETETSAGLNPIREKQPRAPIFKEIYGENIMFGDSNTKGLDAKKLNMKIGSLSGATIDTAINHLQDNNRINRDVKTAIFHLGTNNLDKESPQIITEKLNILAKGAKNKFPNAHIGICEIPKKHNIDDRKITEINTNIKEIDSIHFIKINADSTYHFTQDGVHYNKKGLANVAINLKFWMKEHNKSSSQNQTYKINPAPSPSHINYPQPHMQMPQMWPFFNPWNLNQFPGMNGPFRNYAYGNFPHVFPSNVN